MWAEECLFRNFDRNKVRPTGLLLRSGPFWIEIAAQAALWRAADELVGRPGASDAHAELQQALSGLKPVLTRLISPATARL